MSLLRNSRSANFDDEPRHCACMTSDGSATTAAMGFSVEKNPDMHEQHEAAHLSNIERLHAKLGKLTDMDVRADTTTDEHHAHPPGRHALLTSEKFIDALQDNKAVLRIAYTANHADPDCNHVVGQVTPEHLRELRQTSRVTTNPAINGSSFSLRCNKRGELVGVRMNRGDADHRA